MFCEAELPFCLCVCVSLGVTERGPMVHAKTMSVCRQEECAKAVEKRQGKVLREKLEKTDYHSLSGRNIVNIYLGNKTVCLINLSAGEFFIQDIEHGNSMQLWRKVAKSQSPSCAAMQNLVLSRYGLMESN